MKTIFDNDTRDSILARINSLDENSQPQWGKMNVCQMMKHCSQWDDMSLGKKQYKRSFIGRLFGRIALKDMMKDEPIKRNLPTVPSFKIKDHFDFASERQKWLSSLVEYAKAGDQGFLHPFFGPVTAEQTGIMVYKHIDHHLRQFNK